MSTKKKLLLKEYRIRDRTFEKNLKKKIYRLYNKTIKNTRKKQYSNN